MNPDPNRDKFLAMIEEKERIGDRFRAIRRLDANGGGGTFSLLCEAEDEQRGNAKVALKFLYPFERDVYRRECFEREAVVLERLKGQRDIIQIVAGRNEFIYVLDPLEIPFVYYAVEIAATDLNALIEAEALDAGSILLHFRAMCRAVRRIHNLRIVHRDIKPANFLVMPDGSIRLSDFGTARILDGTTPGLLADYAQFPPGDLAYVAPEMLASLHDDDPSIALGADIFSLGSCLFEMHTGIPLGVQLFDQSFQADLMQAMSAVKRGQRIRTYNQFVTNIANSHHLPTVAAFSPKIPRCIVNQVDDLYRSMAAIDYKSRIRDFEHIFLKLDRCIFTLQNEEKIRRWRQKREKERMAALEKRQRRLRPMESRS
jgi:serine/threonine protein kinase